MINWSVSRDDAALIEQIAARGFRRLKAHRIYRDRMTLIMDITAVHANGCPLRLKELLTAPNFDFYHDLAGIARHLDRRTGKLTNHFLPRFAAPRPASMMALGSVVPAGGTTQES